MNKTLRIALCIAALALNACGPGQKQTVIAEVGGEADAGASSEALDDLAKKDAELAVAILEEALTGEDRKLAAWAAVYAKRLGITHDEVASARAILAGLDSDDDLLACLCWRWAAVLEDTPLPETAKEPPMEPALAAMESAARIARGEKISGELASAIAVAPGSPGKERKIPARKVAAIVGASSPYDDGPLAQAISFSMAVRNGWTKNGRFAASGYRKALIESLGGKADEYEELLPDPSDLSRPMTRLTDRLDLAITSQPRDMLRKVAVNGGGQLRIDAIRALAVVARKPEAGDFGAVAAAMRSKDEKEKVEAARTFLLLTARSAN